MKLKKNITEKDLVEKYGFETYKDRIWKRFGNWNDIIKIEIHKNRKISFFTDTNFTVHEVVIPDTALKLLFEIATFEDD